MSEIISVAPCEGWWSEYTARDGGQPMRERVVAFGILQKRDEVGFFKDAAALVNSGTGGLIPIAEAVNFSRIVHRDDLEVEDALRAFVIWFERMVADPSAYLTEADIAVQRKRLRLFAEQRGVTLAPADTGNEGN